MADELDDILDRAQRKTDRQLRQEIEILTRCSPGQWKRLLPADVDRKKLAQLTAIVRDETLSNQNKAEAIRAIAGLSDIVVDLAAKVAKA
jgi:hypothetical protein